jgi:type I restriction enzyme S subunit
MKLPDGWKLLRIQDLVASLESGVSVNGENIVCSDDLPAVLKINSVTYGTFNPNACKAINGHELSRAKCNPKAGQIIISRSNTSELVGASAYIDKDFPNRFLPDKLWQTIIKTDVDVCTRWLSFWLALPSSRYKLSQLATGTSSSMKNITKGELLSLRVFVPSIEEQRAIADLLSTWDEAIERTEKLIALKEKRFKGLLQELITKNPERDKWKKVKLGEVFTERIDTNHSELPLLSITGQDGVIPRSQTDRKDTSNSDKSKYRKICIGDIGYNTMRMWQGVSGLSKLEGIVSPAYTVVTPRDRLFPEYISYLFKVPEVIHQFYRYSQGLTSDTWNLKFVNFKKIALEMPRRSKQVKIAEMLSLVNNEIDVLEEVTEKYKLEKRGLMQRLLVGKWTVS